MQSELFTIKVKYEFPKRILSHSIPVLIDKMPDIIILKIFTLIVSVFVNYVKTNSSTNIIFDTYSINFLCLPASIVIVFITVIKVMYRYPSH